MSEYTDYLQEVFQRFGPIRMRRMFGGHGLFRDGLMFALVADDTLYLKADRESVGRFEKLGLAPFCYARRGRTVALSYYTAPDAIFDDADEAARWARLAFDAARRAAGR